MAWNLVDNHGDHNFPPQRCWFPGAYVLSLIAGRGRFHPRLSAGSVSPPNGSLVQLTPPTVEFLNP